MYAKAAQRIKSSRRCVAFTGAGISVESGISPFRGKNGLWNKYDPQIFDIHYFNTHTKHSWEVIREIFYDLFGKVRPNAAHYAMAELEANNMLSAVITQNVDNLHYDAGSIIVHEFHGSLKTIICLSCRAKYKISEIDLNILPPKCEKCGGILKPGVVFFGEDIPEPARTNSFNETKKADCFILIGTTGMVAPANMIPTTAKSNGAKIIEINPCVSEYTSSITDIFLEDKATIAMEKLMEELEKI
ncbi:MAG: NAD-dependent deacylase [Desulfobacula sp.]|jgi:NAD-dependent deacetylase|uniref:NAD-dependent protein deacylase n=1 Tax=Desulfobacula sp. TaxID=2593537 RepID=UPI001E0DBBAD|nr:NAD-dependent deacylase [Desulfobacula sp.]MBT3485357.1 NAD-dependent deacylase [Desulfobacula sp.]MBT3803791.1 NAD-dependent deacylase [Desulfobacula sp.]MBT4026625.1 NAD-dependent deacylase [Desulfobacula sp.]MBT4200536.1 NAD-dependent deacylase [Desulfobacula sp.]